MSYPLKLNVVLNMVKVLKERLHDSHYSKSERKAIKQLIDALSRTEGLVW
jgi:GTP-sensing pleiotropic transcriptional regulator CodY